MENISLSARELRVLRELDQVLRRENRHLDRRMRAVGPRVKRAKGGLGRGARGLTIVSAALMAVALQTSGRWTRRITALAFGTVWLMTRVCAPRRVSP